MKELDMSVLTEKGNLKPAVAKEIKAQAITKLEEYGFEVMPNGRLAMKVATVDGKFVTINLDVAVGFNTNFDVKE